MRAILVLALLASSQAYANVSILVSNQAELGATQATRLPEAEYEAAFRKHKNLYEKDGKLPTHQEVSGVYGGRCYTTVGCGRVFPLFKEKTSYRVQDEERHEHLGEGAYLSEEVK